MLRDSHVAAQHVEQKNEEWRRGIITLTVQGERHRNPSRHP